MERDTAPDCTGVVNHGYAIRRDVTDEERAADSQHMLGPSMYLVGLNPTRWFRRCYRVSRPEGPVSLRFDSARQAQGVIEAYDLGETATVMRR